MTLLFAWITNINEPKVLFTTVLTLLYSTDDARTIVHSRLSRTKNTFILMCLPRQIIIFTYKYKPNE